MAALDPCGRAASLMIYATKSKRVSVLLPKFREEAAGAWVNLAPVVFLVSLLKGGPKPNILSIIAVH
jgi:hypothetical protein